MANIWSFIAPTCDITCRNNEGQTALDLAQTTQNIKPDIIQSLSAAWKKLEQLAEEKSVAIVAEAICQSSTKKKKKYKKKHQEVPTLTTAEAISTTINVTVQNDQEISECPDCVDLKDKLYTAFPLFQEMELTVKTFVDSSCQELSMSQLELLQEAHMQMYHVLNEKKVNTYSMKLMIEKTLD